MKVEAVRSESLWVLGSTYLTELIKEIQQVKCKKLESKGLPSGALGKSNPKETFMVTAKAHYRS